MNGRVFNILAIVIVLGLFSVASCQAKGRGLFEKKEKAKDVNSTAAAATTSEANQPEAVVPSKARILFDSNAHDFGKIPPDVVNECKFNFKNVGEDILKIDRLQGTCKCTVPDLSKKDYAPGESGVITVQFHSPKFNGPTSQHVFVFSNDAQTPKAELEIKAFVELAVQPSPENTTLSLVDPNAGADPITIMSNDGERFAVTNIESTGKVVSFKFDPNNISDKHVLKPIINTTYLRNNLNGAITFTTNHPKCKEVRVQWSCLKEFEASPSVIIIRNAAAGDIQQRSIYLTSNYNQPIVIESVASDKGVVKVTNQVQTENRFQFDVEIAPPAQHGQLRVFSDTLRIKIKGKDELAIPCRIFYKIGK